jgi:hypothetical protein
VDERAVPDVHPLVLRHADRVRVEEEEVAGLELVARHAPSLVVLEAGVVAELDPELAVHVHRQARAVEARRGCAAPDIRHAEELERERNGLPAERVRRDIG